MKSMFRLLAAFAAALTMPAAAFAAEWQVDPAASHIGFSGTHAGETFTGQFAEWQATIQFDPDAPEASAIKVVVATASAATGTKLYDSSLPKAEWFDSAAHPEAVFAVGTVSKAGEGEYEATGTLTIKGQAVPITLPFKLGIEGDQAHVSGTVTLDRIALGMGLKSDPDAEWVSREIPVTVELTATRK
jgi:polyisoprenoid-binding protein YceI